MYSDSMARWHMQQVGAMAGGERHSKKHVQWARGEVAARGTER